MGTCPIACRCYNYFVLSEFSIKNKSITISGLFWQLSNYQYYSIIASSLSLQTVTSSDILHCIAYKFMQTLPNKGRFVYRKPTNCDQGNVLLPNSLKICLASGKSRTRPRPKSHCGPNEFQFGRKREREKSCPLRQNNEMINLIRYDFFSTFVIHVSKLKQIISH